MCGIVGILNQGQEALVETALDLISHRGPDDKQFIGVNGTILGHTRLAIQDMSDLGRQPMRSACGRFIIVFNGEIYNTSELLSNAFGTQVMLKGNSDTELLLEFLAYNIKNKVPLISVLKKLNGIFAFVLYDCKLQNSWMVRDHMGIKPLYYKVSHGGVRFCSELAGLRVMNSGADKVVVSDLSRYLCFLWNPGETELIDGVKSVPPGGFIRVSKNGNLEMQKWYNLPLEKNISKTSQGTKNICNQILDTFSDVVKTQLVSDAPVGCFLSGGLDSSAICSLATKFSDNLTFYTIDPGEVVDDQVSDLWYSKNVARHLGVDLNVVQIPHENFLPQLERMVRCLGEPIADPAALNTLLICEAANANGTKVMLSGTGGDDIFTGYRRHVASRYASTVDKYIKPAENYIHFLHFVLQKFGYKNRRLSKLLDSLFLDRAERLVGYFQWSDPSRALGLLKESKNSYFDEDVIKAPIMEYLNTLDKGLSELQTALLLEQRFFMTNHNLIYTDRMSMATGVEVRVPFLDPRMLELASSIPDKYLQKRSIGKWILKKSMEPLLPKNVIYRSKTGFGLPIRKWISGSVNELRDTYLSSQNIRNAGIFDYYAIDKLLSEFDEGHYDLAYTVFAVICCQIWHSECFSS
jgi:asparagine synthase (glutamine-hydrolysing)